MQNQKVLYNSKKIYSDYASRNYLYKAEEAILDRLFPELINMDMLDIGVGGGRTTIYFAPIVKSYTGIDYAHQMIRVCKEKFKDRYVFKESDARSMKEYKDNSFDFVLFSFNGIDSFGHEDRLAALKEIRRVLKNNGYFCFSSHNLNWESLSSLLSFKLNKPDNQRKDKSGNPFWNFFYKAKLKYRSIRLNFLNRSFKTKDLILNLRKKDYGYIYDNSLNGKAKIYYITYSGQIRQLEAAGFKNISSYSINGIKTRDESELNKGGWIYYLCQVYK